MCESTVTHCAGVTTVTNVVDRGRRGLAGARGRSYRRQTMPGRGVPHYLHPLPGGNGKLSQSRY